MYVYVFGCPDKEQKPFERSAFRSQSLACTLNTPPFMGPDWLPPTGCWLLPHHPKPEVVHAPGPGPVERSWVNSKKEDVLISSLPWSALLLEDLSNWAISKQIFSAAWPAAEGHGWSRVKKPERRGYWSLPLTRCCKRQDKNVQTFRTPAVKADNLWSCKALDHLPSYSTTLLVTPSSWPYTQAFYSFLI